MPPTRVREVEERIPAIDEAGNRWTLIRIRTLVGVPGPTGFVEMERDRRHTLPGFGHVYPISRNEYVVFNGHMKLRVDTEAAADVRREAPLNAPIRSEYGVEHSGMTLVSAVPPAAQVRWPRR